jgi:hypothetical protein
MFAAYNSKNRRQNPYTTVEIIVLKTLDLKQHEVVGKVVKNGG